MIRIVLIVLLALSSQICFAQEDAPSKFQDTDNPSGVKIKINKFIEIEWNESGDDWKRIYSEGDAELMFGDAKDIRLATQKATLRAKSNLAKFLNQGIKTSEVMDEMTKSLADKIHGGSEQASRKSVETMIEQIENSAEEILKGVIVLEQDINKPEKMVSVTVGMSKKTMKAADNLRNTIQKDLDAGENMNQGAAQEGGASSNDSERVIKRSKNYDNF